VIAESRLNSVGGLEYDSQALGCGLEDLGISDRYEAMTYGWNQAIESVIELLKEGE